MTIAIMVAGALLVAPLTAMAGGADASASPARSYTLDTPISVLVADPRAKALLDAHFPGLTGHPMYDSFKGMSLSELQPMSSGKMTDAALAETGADLAALTPRR